MSAIGVNRPDEQASPPRVHILDNTIELINQQSGIGCLDCVDSVIAGNFVGRRTQLSGTSPWFTGLHVRGARVQILDNEVLGGGIDDHGRGILVTTSDRADISNDAITVQGNRITNKNGQDPDTGGAYFPALEVRGVADFAVTDNYINNVIGAPGLVIGYCPSNVPVTANGVVGNNRVSMSGSQPAYAIHKTEDVWLLNNLDGGQPLVDADVLNYCAPFEHVVIP